MKIIVNFEKDVTNWASQEEWEIMNDAQIIELLEEDLCELIDDAKWTIKREK